MKNKIKIFLSFFLVLCLLFVSSCGQKDNPPQKKEEPREFSESEVRDAFLRLLPLSVKVNEIFYGYGIPTDKSDTAVTYGNYRSADPAYLSENGIESTESLREAAHLVYTEGMCRVIFHKLEVMYDGDSIIGYKRYYDIPATATEPYRLMVDTKATVYLKDTVVYDTDSLTVTGADGAYVCATIRATVTNADGKSQDKILNLRLFEEANGWRLDTMTYTSYSEYTSEQK